MRNAWLTIGVLLLTGSASARAGVGDPQLRTDHPWYPGELACSSFERLFATQAEVYERVTGTRPTTAEHRALASWLWRNTHYYHGEEGAENLWGQGFTRGGDMRMREYWTGLFAHGFGLCGATHSQWVAEMNALLGHGRARGVGVEDHVSFEAYLEGGAYGSGRWALLDHDISTVVYDSTGKSLLSLQEVHNDWQRLTDRRYRPQRQPWLVCGLAASDGVSYRRYDVAEYLSGYAGVPPTVHLRRGETLRRYFEPGLEDGKAFVFWGRNYNTAGIAGPERSITWVNQPDKMHQSTAGAGNRPGQARFANAVYTYQPDFDSGDYREGVVDEGERHVTFEFYTPYIIGAAPPNNAAWGVYDAGCTNGLVLRGRSDCAVAVSVDQGATWQECGKFRDGLDLTDRVKGHRQYFIRFGVGASGLRGRGLKIVTVCQANAAVLPRLKDGGVNVSFRASGRAVVSAGPNFEQAAARLVGGKFGTSQATLELVSPRQEPIVAVYAAAHVHSGNPPPADAKFQIEWSPDQGKTWQPIVKDWTIARRGHEPGDFWSQSFCWGSAELDGRAVRRVQVRFRNDAGKSYARAEAHIVYRPTRADATRVTYAWSNDGGAQRATHVFAAGAKDPSPWHLRTGRNTRTLWVEMEPAR